MPNLFLLPEPRTPLTPSGNPFDDVMKDAGDSAQHETSKPATTEVTAQEVKEKKDKLIQKEAVETGSVGSRASPLAAIIAVASPPGEIERLSDLHSRVHHPDDLPDLCHVCPDRDGDVGHEHLAVPMDGPVEARDQPHHRCLQCQSSRLGDLLHSRLLPR